MHATLQPKIYKTEIILRDVSSYLFDAYTPLLNK